METVKVHLKSQPGNSYDIVIGRGIVDKIPKDLKKAGLVNNYVIITDSNVKKKYGNKLLSKMGKIGLKVSIITFKAGEKSKDRRTKESIENQMLGNGLGRDTLIIALGGGVVGDIAGFVAATYCRGIRYIQVPTTMLAMADSSVGGKTGVDTEFGKNLIGAFHQPTKVYIDTSILDKLSREEMKNGIAETIKHAVIKDKSFFSYLEKNINNLAKKDPEVIDYVTKRNCEIKSAVVERDEKEKGARKILNYGHTIGHAIESASNYTIPHGKSIALGMIAAAKISAKMGFMPMKDLIRQNSLIAAAGLQTKIRDVGTDKIIKALKYDKKNVDGTSTFILPRSIGDVFFKDDVPLGVLKEVISEMK